VSSLVGLNLGRYCSSGLGPIPRCNGFFQYLNSVQTSKFKLKTFLNSKNVPTLQEARFEPDEQLSPLAQLHIPTVSHVINSEIDSNLNLPSILKRFKPCGKKSGKFIKILS
jgi:hypothetical protein